MANSAAPLMNIFGTTDYLIPLVLDDLSDADARTRARGFDTTAKMNGEQFNGPAAYPTAYFGTRDSAMDWLTGEGGAG
jgi:hypothetical protein